MKNSLGRLNRRSEMAKERVGEIEYRSIKIIQSKQQRKVIEEDWKNTLVTYGTTSNPAYMKHTPSTS